MNEQAPIINPAQEQLFNPDEQVERDARIAMAAAVYSSIAHGEEKREQPAMLNEEDEAEHKELLTQLNSINGTVPEQFQLKRDWSDTEKQHLEKQADRIESVKQEVAERLEAAAKAREAKETREQRQADIEDHNNKLADRDARLAARQEIRDAYIGHQKLVIGLNNYTDEVAARVEREADARVAEKLGPAPKEFGMLDTDALKAENDAAQAKKDAAINQRKQDLSNFYKGFKDKSEPEVTDDAASDGPKTGEKPERPDSGTREEDLDITQERNDEAIKASLAGSYQESLPVRTRDRIKSRMGKAWGAIKDSAFLSVIKGQDALANANSRRKEFYNDQEKSQRRRAVTAMVVGGVAVATVAYFTLKGFNGFESADQNLELGNDDTPERDNGRQSSAEKPNTGAAEAPSEGAEKPEGSEGDKDLPSETEHKTVTLRNGDSIWHQVEHHLRDQHPNWTEQHVQYHTYMRTQEILDQMNITWEQARLLPEGTKVKL